MSGSMKLFSVRGIPVRLHWSFSLVILWAAWLGFEGSRRAGGLLLTRLAFAEAFVILLFVCVALHELAHALTAQMLDIRVQDITLWPLGGLARLARLPEGAFQEFLITAAGPAMSIFLTLMLGALLAAWVGPAQILALFRSPLLGVSMLGDSSAQTLLLLLVFNNAVISVFNLVPAFPLDGGRLLRALLASFLSFTLATRIASITGQVAAGVLLAAALLTQNLVLGLIGVFVFFSAGQERSAAIDYNSLRGLRVRQAMQPLGQRLHPLQTLGQVAALMAGSSQSFYLVVEGGRLAGVLSRGDVLSGLRQKGPETRVSQHMTQDVLRLTPDDVLTEARERLMQNNSWLAVVVEDGNVLGTLSQGDLNRLGDLLSAYPNALTRTSG